MKLEGRNIECLGVLQGFPGGAGGKEPACQSRRRRDVGSIPASERSPEGGHSNPLQYSCLENPMDRGAWQAMIHGVTRVGHDLVTKPSKVYEPPDRSL